MPLQLPGWRARRIAREAAEWRIEMLEFPSKEVSARFETWLAANPEHRRAYAELEPFTSLSRRSSHRPERAVGAQSARSALRPAWAMGGATAIAATALLYITAHSPQPAFAAIDNPGPFVRSFRLADGSTLILDVQSAVEVAPLPAREVRLRRGRARFILTAGSAGAFRVSTADASVVAHGGAFDVALSPEGSTVVPLHGSLIVSAAPADAASKISAASPTAVHVQQGKVATGARQADLLWPASKLSFERTALRSIVSKANRFGGPPIRLSDDRLGTIEVTAVLDLRDTRSLARKLAAALDLNVIEERDQVLLTR